MAFCAGDDVSWGCFLRDATAAAADGGAKTAPFPQFPRFEITIICQDRLGTDAWKRKPQQAATVCQPQGVAQPMMAVAQPMGAMPIATATAMPMPMPMQQQPQKQELVASAPPGL